MNRLPHDRSRRRFLKRATLAGAALACPSVLLADPYRPLPVSPGRAAPVRVRGRVASGGRGLAGVAVTDGVTVAATDAEGAFELIADGRRPFVYLSMPAGYAVPRNPTGTARFYAPMRPDGGGEMQAVFDLEPLATSDERHAFFVLADPQTEDGFEMSRFHAETVPDVRATAAALGETPVFGLTCGDIMYDHLDLYPEYERAVAAMGLPFFQVIGNHDLDLDGMTDEASAHTFAAHFGPTHYSFDRGAVHYVVLDDVFWHAAGYLGYLDADQLGWLAQDLARIEPGRTVVVFTHIPALSTRFRRAGGDTPPPAASITNREALYRLLEPFDAHLITGHTHENEHVFEHGTHEHVCGTVCGAWWSGDICYDGTPNGYAVFEARGEELRWRYKSTGRDAGHQMRVYGRGADPKAPDEIVANVWDWDPAWTVVWYENGERKGAMARRTGTDPLSERLHRGPDKPEHRPWVEPVPVEHLFYAPVAPDAADVRVEATDRFGRTYTASPEPPEPLMDE
ncbi:calcineurin-like phosphoesterase C-terminal domain-containing protein [Rhodocaloribacter sp.]